MQQEAVAPGTIVAAGPLSGIACDGPMPPPVANGTRYSTGLNESVK